MSESVETLVKQILAELSDSGSASQGAANRPISSDEATAADYPISKKHPDWIKVGQDKKFEDITLENILSGYVKAEDLRIKPEILIKQGEIAKNAGREAIQYNFSRAAELTKVRMRVCWKSTMPCARTGLPNRNYWTLPMNWKTNMELLSVRTLSEKLLKIMSAARS